MKIYLVGGAVRDALMAAAHGGASPAHADRDWVVVGATPAALADQGYLPVGRDFPVFLHPHTREEHALARTERKTARGYHGFAFQADEAVTLEQDLARRDLSINAMAVPAAVLDATGGFDTNHLIDPFGGRADLADQVRPARPPLDLAGHDDPEGADVANHLTCGANRHRCPVALAGLDIAYDLAVNAHAVQENQPPIDGGGAPDQGVKSFLSVCKSFVSYFFKHGHNFLKNLKGP